MPRPMMPAPMTAMVRTSAIRLSSLLQLLDHTQEVGVGLAHVFGEAVFLVGGDQVKAGVDATQGRGDVVNVIHHADEFTSGRHNNPFTRCGYGNNAKSIAECRKIPLRVGQSVILAAAWH